MAQSAPPPPPPTGGNGKYIVALIIALLGIGALLYFRSQQKPVTVTQIVTATPTATPTGDDNDVPPPPEVPDAGGDTGPVKTTPVSAGDPCNVKSCGGKTTDEIESTLAVRARAARKCYDQLLAQDQSLKGQVKVKVRIASNGLVCSAVATANDTGSQSVERCATNPFRGIQTAAPKGGCVDVEIPMNFKPAQ